MEERDRRELEKCKGRNERREKGRGEGVTRGEEERGRGRRETRAREEGRSFLGLWHEGGNKS
jgi:hypothetical protein